MRSKIHSSYDPETGVSTVVKDTKYGQITGTAHVHESDMDIANQWDGCRFAEYKADMETRKRKVQNFYQRAIGARTVYNNLLQAYSEDDPVILAVERQAKIAWRDYENEAEKLRNVRSNYSIYVSNILSVRRGVRASIDEYGAKHDSE